MTRLQNRLNALSHDYAVRYEAMVNRLVQNELNNWQVNAKEFTDHGANHCRRINEVFDKLIPDSVLIQLNATEIYFLLSSAWLHDLGMMVQQVGQEILEPKEIRERHNELTKNYLLNDNKYREYSIYTENEARIIADICLCHRKESIPSICDSTTPLGTDLVHTRFLCALLRLGDEMDMDFRRASECTADIVQLRGDSLNHWKACQLINGITCYPTNSTIEVLGIVSTNDERLIASNAIRKLNDERSQVMPFFEFGLRYDNIRLKIQDKSKRDEFVLTFDDIGEQLFQQMYKRKKGQGVIFNPILSADQLKDEIEKMEAQAI